MPPPANLPTGFRISLPVLIKSLLPSILRKDRQLAWLNALNAPAAWLYARFAEFYFSTRTELSYNGQTLLLEKALNDRFDPLFRRIRIINSDTELSPVYLNFVAEQQALPSLYFVAEGAPPFYVGGWVEYTNQVGFTVRLPRSLRLQEVAIQARILALKLALIRHKLLYV